MINYWEPKENVQRGEKMRGEKGGGFYLIGNLAFCARALHLYLLKNIVNYIGKYRSGFYAFD
jgi:hypothetical protein